MGILSTAVTGLLISQRALATTGHNISNVNTQGYTRQRVDVIANSPQFTGAGYIGRGVTIAGIERIANEFLTLQVRNSTSNVSENDTFFSLASRIDSTLADEQTGLSPSLLNFFNAVQDVADIPSSISARQNMLSEAQSLADRFQFLNARMTDLVNVVRTDLKQNVTEINSLAQAIADINNQIVAADGDPNLQAPNDLLDQREELVRQLAGFVSVETIEQDNGALNVFIGKGQGIVLGSDASSLSVSEPYQGNFDISLTGAFSTSVVTDSISGGSIGGLLRFQDEMLDPARNSLGRLAIGLADTFNSQHNLGMTLDGSINLDFFNISSSEVIPLAAAPNNVTSTIVDTSSLTNSNYNLTFNGGTSYTLTRLSDNQTTAIDTLGASPFTTATVDGFNLTITAGATAGDQFVIRPVANGARDISVAISDPRSIAAASPLRSGVAVNSNGLPTNLGDAQIGQVSLSSTTGIPVASAITLTFDSALNQFTVSAPPGGTLAYNPATESGGKQFSFATIGNATFTISGTPADGDQFVIENNSNADGDNRNALSLASLQTSLTLLGGTASYQDTYGQFVAEVGTQTRQAEVSSTALNSLLNQATEARESLSGVNLDEEAADMLKFQRAYQASAQMISTADQLFQTLLQAFR